MTPLGTAQLAESDEYQDVTMRVHTNRGSMPIQLVCEGVIQTPESIGRQVLDLFNYFVESPVFNAARTSTHARCVELGICFCPTTSEIDADKRPLPVALNDYL